MEKATAGEVKAGNLPQLILDHNPPSTATHPASVHPEAGHPASSHPEAADPEAAHTPAAHPEAAHPAAAEHHWYTGVENVAEDIGKGAVDEVVHHPLRVLASFGIGVGTAAIASVVAAPVAIGATVAGLGYGAYQIYKHAPGWIESAKELNHPENYSAQQLAQADKTWQNFGGGATDLAAGIAGGVAYRAASTAISEAMEDAVDAHPVKTAAATSATTNDGGASSQAATPTGDGGASSHGAAAVTPGDGGASSHAAGTVIPGDGGTSAHSTVVLGAGNHHSLIAGAQIGASPDGSDGGAIEAVTGAANSDAAAAAADASATPTGASTAAGEAAKAIAPAEKAVPSLEKPIPTIEKPMPSLEKPIPALEKPIPAAENPLPAAEKPILPEAKPVAEVAAPAMTSEEAALANSIKASQGAFNDAIENGEQGVVESTKQLYNVRFEKVTEDAGRRLFTLENRSEGVLVPKGAFIATRLDAAGNPVIEDGIQNSWSMQAAKIGKTYQVDPETLASSEGFVAPTRVDGPSVHMVQLDKPTEIITKWGAMKGKIGDWLANYDFNKTSGTPGNDYAIVSGESYKQTYQPKPKL